MNSFFLSRLLPPNTEGSGEQSEAIGASWRTQVRTFNTCTLCPDSSLWVNFLLFHYSHSDFYNRSRMTGRYLISFRKKPFSCLLTLAPSDGWRRHLSQRQSVSLTFTASLRSSKSGSLASRQAGTAYRLHSSFIFQTRGDRGKLAYTGKWRFTKINLFFS